MSMPHINQVYMMFMGKVPDGQFSPGIESLETQLFDEEEIPWSEMAFHVISKTLQCYFYDRKEAQGNEQHNYPVHNLVYHVAKK